MEKMMAEPKKGYYKLEDSRVQVIATGTYVGEAESPLYVVFRHHGSHAVHVCTLEEWGRDAWMACTLSEFKNNGMEDHTLGKWILHSIVTKGNPSNSSQIHIARCWDPIVGADHIVSHTRIHNGKGSRMVKPLDGKTYRYRNDARAAKEAYCKAHNIRKVPAGELFGDF